MEQTFGEFVAARRAELGIPLSTFADLVGRSTGTVRSWERGRARPGDPKTLGAIAAVLDVDEAHLAHLAGGERLAPPPAPEPPPVPDALPDQSPSTGSDVAGSPTPGTDVTDPTDPDGEPATVGTPLPWVTTDVPVERAPTSAPGAPLAGDRLPWLPLPPAHTVLDRSDDGIRYPLRVAATIVAVVVMLLVLQWALGEFATALGDLRTSMFG